MAHPEQPGNRPCALPLSQAPGRLFALVSLSAGGRPQWTPRALACDSGPIGIDRPKDLGVAAHPGNGLSTPLIVEADAHQRQAFGNRAVGRKLLQYRMGARLLPALRWVSEDGSHAATLAICIDESRTLGGRDPEARPLLHAQNTPKAFFFTIFRSQGCT